MAGLRLKLFYRTEKLLDVGVLLGELFAELGDLGVFLYYFLLERLD
jgi:hypothetical protein